MPVGLVSALYQGMNVEWVGWASSFLLIVAIAAQVFKEWKSGSKASGSLWLYSGQILAEAGFVYYSLEVGNWVFVVTNAILLVLSLIGLVLRLRSH